VIPLGLLGTISPMKFLFREIRTALDNKLRILALHGAMSIPDICSALETDKPTASGTIGPRYAKWFNRYLGPTYTSSSDGTPILTGEDIWYLRCKMQHQGAIAHDKHSARIVFSRNNHGFLAENCAGVVGREVSLVPETFAKELLDAGDRWLQDTNTDSNVQRRMSALMEFYPHGVSPQIRAPVIG
jgi:hypothetical protein